MLGATVTFPYVVDPNAGNYNYAGPQQPFSPNYYPMNTQDLALDTLPLRSTPLYGGSNQFATDAITASPVSSIPWGTIAIFSIIGLVVAKL